MKHSKKSKLLALVLVLCLSMTTVTPASAAGFSFGRSSSFSWSTILERLFGGSAQTPSTPEAPSEPETGSDTSTESGSTGASGGTMTLVEDETTVSEGTALRASTYILTNTAGSTSTYDLTGDTTTLKYFPVTMYDYDTTIINNATHKVEVNNGLSGTWNGIYFSKGDPAAESFTYTTASRSRTDLTWEELQNDGYYFDEACIIPVKREDVQEIQDNGEYTEASVTCDTLISNNSNSWTACSDYYYKADDGQYYPLYAKRSRNWGYYTYTWGYSTTDSASNVKQIGTQKPTNTNTDPNITVYTYTDPIATTIGYVLKAGGSTIARLDGTNTAQQVGVTLYTSSSTETASSQTYAAWNRWNKGDSTQVSIGNGKTQKYGQYTYSGLVESTLTANKDITFTKPDGGIFNSDAMVKTVYNNVEMPFVYENGTYTFDASKNGVYFYADSTQGSTAAQSNGRLYFNEGKPQSNGGNYGDGSATVWMPFNSTQSINGEGNCDYHFGMRTTIPFTMTANGKMNPNDNNSKDITFSFSGDDDVWIFIDGQLVIDLGGIHNRLDATINFAENTWSISATNSVASYVAAADYNGADISGTLFNVDDATGTLNQTRATFAATDSHELTIFYLERGAGSSNCKIQFNLPMKDTLSVTKRITKAKTENSDGTVTTSPLSAKEQVAIDQMDFGFTLYKDGSAAGNISYNLLNANGQVISTPATDANGHFTLRNGQTAKFVGAISSTGGNSYYVVEDEKAGFWVPDYTYTADVAGGENKTEEASGWSSMKVTVTGSDEAEDHVTFVCENYMDNKLANPGVLTGNDRIVIDYGLPVIIDVLANDVYRGETIELTDVTGAQYGTATIENGKITYQLTEQLTNVEVLTYTVEVTGTETNVGGGTNSDTITDTGTVYIIPATSMYYEENFSGLVTFSDGWSDVGTAQTDPQEPGVVGTVGDSPYGSDAAYLNDSGDSNGSSKYVNTTNGSATFSYTFTGTGTSFFARTSGTAAYMRVVVTESDGTTVSDTRRNNIYKSAEGTDVGTLYNVPVYTIDSLGYGTYTVTVTLMKANAAISRGPDFYLDGIRVINPLDDTDANASVAKSAYATDGEANMAVVTLRQKLIGEAKINEDETISWNEGDNFVLFTDTNGKITSAEEYKSNGPKEEVYLNNGQSVGQSVTFSLKNWDANTNKIYLGIKAPLGTGTVSINGNTLNINNATDCYYDISSYAAITTGEGGVKTATFEVKATSSLISVTNIKVTGNAEFTIFQGQDIKPDADTEE